MSYEDLEEARAERALKTAKQEARKSAKEAKKGQAAADPGTAQASGSESTVIQKRKRYGEGNKGTSHVAEDEIVEQWTAPVARMW